ncbi:putative Ig domain-containing protein, partial [Rhizobiaceae bacterium]|nr:putative Ig domain-containing protein [Rhizobiaceae bacterium]
LNTVDSATVDFDLSGTFGDVDGPVAISVEGLPPGLVFEPLTGRVTGTLPNDASVSGPYTVVVTGSGDEGSSVSTDWTINVSNPAPVADVPPAQVREGEVLTIELSQSVIDPDGDALGYAIGGIPGWLTLDPVTGVLTGTPPAGSGDTTVTLQLVVSDEDGGQTTTPIVISILPPVIVPVVPVDPPVATETPQDMAERREDFRDSRFPVTDERTVVRSLDPVRPILVDAVRQADGLASIQSLDGDKPHVVQAVENFGRIPSIGTLDGERGAVLNAVAAIDALRELRGETGLTSGVVDQSLGDRSTSTRADERDTAPSDTLRFIGPFDAGDGTLSDDERSGGEIVVRAVVRGRVVYLDVADTFVPDLDGVVLEHRLAGVGGAALPEWITTVRPGFFAIERPEGTLKVDVTVRTIMRDGRILDRTLVVDGVTGNLRDVSNIAVDNGGLESLRLSLDGGRDFAGQIGRIYSGPLGPDLYSEPDPIVREGPSPVTSDPAQTLRGSGSDLYIEPDDDLKGLATDGSWTLRNGG